MAHLIRIFAYRNVTYLVIRVISTSFLVIVYFLSGPKGGEKNEQHMNIWITPICVGALTYWTLYFLHRVTRVKEDQLLGGRDGGENEPGS